MVALPILAGIGTARPSIHCRFLSAPSSASMQSRPEPVRSAASCSVQLPARWFCSSDARRSHARVGRSCAWRSHWSSRPQPRSQVIRRRPRSSAWPRHPKDGVRSLRSRGQRQLASLPGKRLSATPPSASDENQRRPAQAWRVGRTTPRADPRRQPRWGEFERYRSDVDHDRGAWGAPCGIAHGAKISLSFKACGDAFCLLRSPRGEHARLTHEVSDCRRQLAHGGSTMFAGSP